MYPDNSSNSIPWDVFGTLCPSYNDDWRNQVEPSIGREVGPWKPNPSVSLYSTDIELSSPRNGHSLALTQIGINNRLLPATRARHEGWARSLMAHILEGDLAWLDVFVNKPWPEFADKELMVDIYRTSFRKRMADMVRQQVGHWLRATRDGTAFLIENSPTIGLRKREAFFDILDIFNIPSNRERSIRQQLALVDSSMLERVRDRYDRLFTTMPLPETFVVKSQTVVHETGFSQPALTVIDVRMITEPSCVIVLRLKLTKRVARPASLRTLAMGSVINALFNEEVLSRRVEDYGWSRAHSTVVEKVDKLNIPWTVRNDLKPIQNNILIDLG